VTPLVDTVYPGPVSDDPLTALTAALEWAVEAEEHLNRAVTAARAAGATWADIGDALGITRQAAHKRFAGHNQKENHVPT
jgi:hypothetical protein